jgi:MFS family permease
MIKLKGAAEPDHAGAEGAVATDRARCSSLLMAGKFLSSLAFFSAAPYLTLYLSAEGRLSPAAAGAAVGSIALIAGGGGVLGGYLIDRFGAVRLMRLSLVLYSAVYLLLALTRSVPLMVAAVALMGVARLALEPSVKKLMSATAGDDPGATFRRRYFTIAIAAIVGPVIGGTLYYAGGTTFFLVPAGTLAVYWLFITTVGRRLAAYDALAGPGSPPRTATAFRDRRLLLVVAGGLVMFTVFSQFDSALPLLMHQSIGRRAVAFYSALLIADAVLGMTFLRLVTWLGRNWKRRTLLALGCACFAAGFLLFALIGISLAFLVPGILAFSAGEAILLPIPDIMLHEIAPPDLKATYYGLGESRYLGFFIGPVIGGACLQAGHLIFGIQAAVVAAAAYLILARIPDIAHHLEEASHDRRGTAPGAPVCDPA